MIRPAILSSTAALAAAFLFLVAPASGVDFSDRDLLVDTLDRYADTALQIAQDELADANQALADAIAAGDAEEAERLETEVIPALEDAVARNENFDAEVAEIVDEMTDAQVVAMNRALQNTRNNGIVPTIGLEELQRVVNEGFNDDQIRSFVMAYRENAKFLAKAERFDEGSKQYDRAIAKAESKKDKFLGKVDRFAGPVVATLPEGDSARAALGDLTHSLAAKAARSQAKASARASAGHAAKSAAKDFAQNEARRAAKKQAVQLSKQDRAKGAKGLAKGKNK